MSNQAVNTFEDLTGVSTSSFSNPYDALIAACEDDPVRYPDIWFWHLLSR
jgi:vesicle-fusing ATPase